MNECVFEHNTSVKRSLLCKQAVVNVNALRRITSYRRTGYIESKKTEAMYFGIDNNQHIHTILIN